MRPACRQMREIIAGKCRPAREHPWLRTAAIARSSNTADPRLHFYLALAHDVAGQEDKAREELISAQTRKLSGAVLTTEERGRLDRLRDKLNVGPEVVREKS